MRATPEPAEEDTGLPGLRTWRAVYWAVVLLFAVYVLLLVWLSGVSA